VSSNLQLTLTSELVRVLVADSTVLTGRLIADWLRRDRDLDVVDVSGRSVLAVAARLTPQVAIISSQLDGKSGKGFDILARLRALAPQTRVIMLLDCDEPNSVVAAFRGGARGVFCRNNRIKLLSRCVHKVHEGQLWVSGPQLETLLATFASAPATQLVDSQGVTLLSKREEDVVRWLAEGLTNSEIADQLNLSENTVKNHLFRIYNKLGVSTRVEAVIYAAGQSA
jgi:two-component system, NarL family, nitrate/nitrite response regulator NarL